MAVSARYPVRVDAALDPELSRWLWLVKWLLAVPHYFVLAFLWLGFVFVSIFAFFAILFTGRYPSELFDFNVGVLRWSWRVVYYSYGALGTDHYPPFTLDEVPDYPAHLEVRYPEHLSRGLVLVKSWLLAVPHYLVVGVFAGGGLWAAWETNRNAAGWGTGGLIGLLVVVAGVVLLVTGRYPPAIFDLVLGLNRWVLRVAAYASLMTDEYPPFRLDMGGPEPGALAVTSPPPASPTGTTWLPGAAPPPGGTVGVVGTPSAPPGTPPAPGGPPGTPTVQAPPRRPGWTGGRVVAVVAGGLLGLGALGLLAAGGGATWLNVSQRDDAGFVTTGTRVFATAGYAIASSGIDLGSSDVGAPAAFLGTVRVRATSVDPARPIFIGIAPSSAVNSYLAGVGHEVVTGWASARAVNGSPAKGTSLVSPTALGIWAVSASGTGTQTVQWRPTTGNWKVVVMNPDASPGLSVRGDAGATIPGLRWIAVGLFVAGGLLLLVAVLLVALAVSRASRRATTGPPTAPWPGPQSPPAGPTAEPPAAPPAEPPPA